MSPVLLAALVACTGEGGEASAVREVGPGAVTLIYQSRGEGEIEPCG